jgi:conjugative relaxase-like TrwC/TraI family protein
MLSIGKIALGQHRYYEQQVAQGQDDYYSGRGEAPGEWVGVGAGALGLDGRVSARDFSALLAGVDPRDPSVRLRSSDRDPKVAALDLTFSAPKSVSVLAAIGDDELARELIVAHEQALRAALSYLEDTSVHVRRGAGGERVQNGGGLIAVAYRHRMSRALDPQLHTHVVAANLTRGPDGRYTALHGASLYRAAKTAGYLYQAHLRALISERLGLRWGSVRNGAAELALVPDQVLAEFSKRRHEMQRAAQEGGIALDTKAGAQAAALATRDRKQYGIDTHTWREEVTSRAAELGLGARELAQQLECARARTIEHERVHEHRFGEHLAGPEGLTANANTFDERAVLQEFAAAAREGAGVGEIRAQSRRFVSRPDVIPTQRGEMTTAGLIACEEALIAAVIDRTDECCGLVVESLVQRAIAAASSPLTDEQAAAVRAVALGGHGIAVIEALAGTGKTYTAGILRSVYEHAGYLVIGVAPTGRAARELQERAGIASRTLDRLLLDVEQLGDSLPRRCVVILDEAGAAPTRTSARLLKMCAGARAKVIAIGDPGQLSSVQAGGWLGAVGRALGAIRLSEVMRQRDPLERRALAVLHDGQPERYLRWAQDAGRMQTFTAADRARVQAVALWRTAVTSVGVEEVVMIARDNDTREALNDAARECRRALGLLGVEHDYATVALAVGDRVICRRNNSLVDVDNGTRGTVRHAGEDGIVIDTDSGATRELPARYVQDHVEHAYALTGHGMQGATVEHAVVLASPHDLTGGWSYTALSRARGATHVLIHERAQERSEFAPDDRVPASRADLLACVERRMRERDDEDLAVEQLLGTAGDSTLAISRSLALQIHEEQTVGRTQRRTPEERPHRDRRIERDAFDFER